MRPVIAGCRPAALFDIDGTLVDSNYLQVQAWSQSFQALGVPVDDARTHRVIALDSAMLLDNLQCPRDTGINVRECS